MSLGYHNYEYHNLWVYCTQSLLFTLAQGVSPRPATRACHCGMPRWASTRRQYVCVSLARRCGRSEGSTNQYDPSRKFSPRPGYASTTLPAGHNSCLENKWNHQVHNELIYSVYVWSGFHLGSLYSSICRQNKDTIFVFRPKSMGICGVVDDSRKIVRSTL